MNVTLTIPVSTHQRINVAVPVVETPWITVVIDEPPDIPALAYLDPSGAAYTDPNGAYYTAAA